jgi:putative membrane protein
VAGATFRQRYGLSLEELVQQLATDRFRVQGAAEVHEDWKHVNVFLTETIHHERKAVSGPIRRLLRRRTRDSRVDLGPEGQEVDASQADGVTSHIVVLASGNLGLIYSARLDERASLEQIEAVYPGLLDGLAQHEGVGFVLVHSQAHGPVVIGAGGRSYLGSGCVEGEDPLSVFGPNAAVHLRRTDRFTDAPDILVSSFYDPETGEVAAFEELIGSHGGLGGWQTAAFSDVSQRPARARGAHRRRGQPAHSAQELGRRPGMTANVDILRIYFIFGVVLPVRSHIVGGRRWPRPFKQCRPGCPSL